eukprot:c25065_g1_i2 orf=605-1291(-)
MKFLEYTPLARIDAFLRSVNLGDSLLKGTVEAYSCKVAGADKKLSRSLEQEVLDYLAVLPSNLSVSPVGPLSSLASRRTLIHLILTLSHMYPDYDFSEIRPYHFSKEQLCSVHLKIENYLLETAKAWATEFGEDIHLLDCLWNSIDEVIELEDCDVYSYMPDFEADPFAERGTIWSFNYFFYNWKLKRILYFSCRCVSKLAMDDDSTCEIVSDNDADFVPSMDMEELM